MVTAHVAVLDYDDGKPREQVQFGVISFKLTFVTEFLPYPIP